MKRYWAGLAICVTLLCPRMQAGEREPSFLSDWWNGSVATGNWFGVRDTLDEHGIAFSGSYITDLLGNPVGGESQGFANFQWLELGFSFDMEKIVGWKEGRIAVSVLSVAGQDLSAHYIGNYFTASELETSMNTFVLYDLFVEQRLWDDRIRIKVGRYAAGEDVGKLSILGLYVNGAIDSHPLGLEGNFVFPTPPKPTWTALVDFNITDDLSLTYAIWQANSWYRLPQTHGWDMGIRPGDGISMIWEFEWRPKLRLPWGGRIGEGKESRSAGFPAEYRFGVYYSNFSYHNFTTNDVVRDNYGFYWYGQQQIWQESPESAQGVTIWSIFTFAPQDEIAQFPFNAASGFSWQGAIPGRNNDLILVGSYYGNISKKFAAAQDAEGGGYPTYEWALEWSYRMQVNQWLYVQPDIQWIINPGGTGDIPNALVLGGEIGVTF